MNKISGFLFCSAVVSASLLSCVDSKEPAYADTENTKNQANISPQDSQFVAEAYSAGLFDIQLSEHVENLFNDPKIKDLAEKIVIAHSELNKQLKDLADSKGIILAVSLTKNQNEDILKMSSKNGKEFDQLYLQKMTADHENAVSLFEKASNSATNDDVKKLFAGALPQVKNHLEMVKAAGEPMP